MFKFEGNQKVFLTDSGHPVTIFGRTEFFNGKVPRYYIVSETAIPGKNHSEDWVNEDKLTDVAPVMEEEAPQEAAKTSQGKKGIRKQGLKS